VLDGRLSVEAAHHFARVYGAARAGCLSELRRAGCTEEEAEEIFAATFERIMRRRDPPREGFSVAQTVALLKRACGQKLIDERRHRDVLRLVPLEEAASRADPATSPPGEAERREAAEIAREALSGIPERDRRVFLQRHLLDLSPGEVLRRNPRLSPRTYRKLLQRARSRTREAFVQIAGGARCAEMRGERLRRYLDREAGEAEAREVRAHLRRCPACRFEAARMRGGLHGFAAGLLALFGFARERLRELALRLAGGLPGSGGEGAAGQVAGISGAKALTACAATATAAACLAAGVVPGVGGLGLSTNRRAERPAAKPARGIERAATRRVGPAPSAAHAPPAPESSTPRSNREESAAERRARARREGARAASASEPSRASRPTVSGSQTGAEFGAEAEGTGTPAPSSSSPESAGASHGESEHASGSGSQVGDEFGL
jgi:RNA polymerase sigma factor (sigma-70 family)